MLGPLPTKYRLILVLVAVAGGLATGAWLAWSIPAPIVVWSGALVGTAAGLVAAYALIHDFSHPATGRMHRRG